MVKPISLSHHARSWTAESTRADGRGGVGEWAVGAGGSTARLLLSHAPVEALRDKRGQAKNQPVKGVLKAKLGGTLVMEQA